MQTRDYYYLMSDEQRAEMAEDLGITKDYLRKVMTGVRKPSKTLAKALSKATPFNTGVWRPDQQAA